jgi:hypothetical protein
VTDLELAELCQSIYYTPSLFDSIISNNDVYCGRKGDVIAFRGTDSARDILLDIEAAVGEYVPMVGLVCRGFHEGVVDAFDRLRLNAGDEITLTGHSLGCAHAAYIARYCLLRGITVTDLVLFEPPLCGNREFIDGLHNVKRIPAYRNGNDIVPTVPKPSDSLPVVQFNLTSIGTTEKLGGQFEDHLISNVIKSLSEMI